MLLAYLRSYCHRFLRHFNDLSSIFLLQVILECLGEHDDDSTSPRDVPAGLYPRPPKSYAQVLQANKVVATIVAAEKPGQELRAGIDQIVHPTSWTESLAHCVLEHLERILRDGSKMGPALKEAFDKAVHAAEGFARDHPVYTTLIALGVLAILLPWVVEALGFAELGPVEGWSCPD